MIETVVRLRKAASLWVFNMLHLTSNLIEKHAACFTYDLQSDQTFSVTVHAGLLHLNSFQNYSVCAQTFKIKSD